ncbi:retrotransposon protein, putative, ty1-copia subclass [Tanacetum coccineum]
MTRKSFSHHTERATDLLSVTLTDVCGPLRHVSRQGASYNITFTDDYSRYGYIYLLKHKHEVFKTFKVFKNEVENQLGKTIKALPSDRGGEYISLEFKDYLKACGIVQQLTPPYTPQHNRIILLGLCSRVCCTHSQYGSNQEVGGRENLNKFKMKIHHLLKSLAKFLWRLMNLTTLSLSFWDYALESATHIFNMVPTKKVEKTPYELCSSTLSFWDYALETATRILIMVSTKKVWGCEAPAKRDTPDKLQQRSVKCIFIGYPKETMGYYCYFPPENKIVVARYAEFFEKNLLSQEVSGRAGELKEIQDEDTSPSEITSEIPMEVEGFEPPHEEDAPVRRFVRTHRAPERLCLNIEVKEHSLGDLNEPANYKAIMLDSESNKWIDAMNAEMQSMKDNQVWHLVDLPPDCKTVGSKWIFKKKTDMDGIVHTYKARLVAKDQLYGVDYEETFLPVAYIRAIRILIAIAALQSVKTYLGKCFAMKDLGEAAFILGIKIYRDRSKRLIELRQSAYMDKILKRFKMDTSKRGYIPMQERLDLNKTQGASTPGENPGEPHYPAVKTFLKYLRNTKDMFLVYGGNPEAELRVDCYCNAGFETDKDDTKSQTGYVFILNGGAVDWKSSKQSTTAMSATEVEYIAASKAAMEAVWIRKFISGLGIVPTINEPIKMFCDNSAALHVVNEPRVQKGARHYHRRYHYVREGIKLGKIKFLKVHTDNNLADLFMKALSNGKLTQHARSMGLRLASSFMSSQVHLFKITLLPNSALFAYGFGVWEVDILLHLFRWLFAQRMAFEITNAGFRFLLYTSVHGDFLTSAQVCCCPTAEALEQKKRDAVEGQIMAEHRSWKEVERKDKASHMVCKNVRALNRTICILFAAIAFEIQTWKETTQKREGLLAISFSSCDGGKRKWKETRDGTYGNSSDGKWDLPNDWYGQFSIVTNILEPKIDLLKSDSVIWKADSGKELDFAVKNVCEDIRLNGPHIEHSRQIQETGNYAVNRCYLRMKDFEDLDHLFFKCEFSRDVWNKAKNFSDIKGSYANWTHMVQSLANGNNGNNINSVVSRLIFAAIVYCIWHERNCRIFRNERRKCDDILKFIIETVKMKLMCIMVKDGVAVRRIEQVWTIVCKKKIDAT